jgi:hypothetical protein
MNDTGRHLARYHERSQRGLQSDLATLAHEARLEADRKAQMYTEERTRRVYNRAQARLYRRMDNRLPGGRGAAPAALFADKYTSQAARQVGRIGTIIRDNMKEN